MASTLHSFIHSPHCMHSLSPTCLTSILQVRTAPASQHRYPCQSLTPAKPQGKQGIDGPQRTEGCGKASVQKAGAYQYDCQHKNLPVKEGPCQTAQGIVQKHQGNSSPPVSPRDICTYKKAGTGRPEAALNTTGSIMTNTARITYFTLDSSCGGHGSFLSWEQVSCREAPAPGQRDRGKPHMVPSHGNPKEQENSQYIEGKLPVHGGQGILQGYLKDRIRRLPGMNSSSVQEHTVL